MKISKLIEILQLAQQNYGDVDVMIEDYEGQKVIAKHVFKLHPYENMGRMIRMVRDEPVNAVAITDVGWREDRLGGDDENFIR